MDLSIIGELSVVQAALLMRNIRQNLFFALTFRLQQPSKPAARP